MKKSTKNMLKYPVDFLVHFAVVFLAAPIIFLLNGSIATFNAFSWAIFSLMISFVILIAEIIVEKLMD